MPTSAARDLVFVSYSHANPDWRDKLLLLLKPFVRQGRLQVWADPDPYIRTGDIWRRTIDEALARTRVGVVLLTPDLLASDFVAEVEVPSLLRAAHARDLILVVVPIEPLVEGSTRFPDGDLKQFQWPWTPEEPIAELDDRRQMRALVTVANAIVASAVSEEPLPAESATIERRSTTSVLTPSDRLGGLYGVPPFPPHYIPRVREHEMLKDAVVGEKTVIGVSAGGMRVGVHGQGGLGKSVLAVSVAHDERVRRMFPDGVFWIPIGQQPDIASLQAYLAEQFGESAGIGDEATGTRVLKKRLDGKACLIVLDDVWRLIHVKAFDVLDARSRLLVTTRDRSILTDLDASEMRLDALSTDAALDLLARWAASHVHSLSAVAGDIAKEVDYLPLGLALAGARIRDGCSWEGLLAALRAGRLDFLDHPYGSIFASIKTSVDALDPPTRARYLELAVFPEDIAIPAAVVETLWQATAGTDPHDTRALLDRLAAQSLLSLSDGVGMHDLQRDFVRLVTRDLAGVHASLIDAWGDLHHLRDAFAWRWVGWHLCRANRRERLRELLLDFSWIVAKLKVCGVGALIADYEYVQDRDLDLVQRALLQSAQILARSPEQLAGQLLGRLTVSQQPEIAPLVGSVERTRLGPCLQPLRPSLANPALVRSLERQGDWVHQLAVSEDGRYIVWSLTDGTLCRWNAAFGEPVEVFVSRGSQKRLAMSSDGRFIVSAREDEPVTVWDMTGEPVATTLNAARASAGGLALSGDGRWIVLGSKDGEVTVWERETGTLAKTLVGHVRPIMAIAVSGDAQWIAAKADGGTVKVWARDEPAAQTLEGLSPTLYSLAMSRDGRWLASSGLDDQTVVVWDRATGRITQTLRGHGASILSVAASCDGRWIVSGSKDQTVRVWERESGQLARTFEGHGFFVSSVAASADGRWIVSGSYDETVKVWDREETAPMTRRHVGRVNSLAVSADGRWIVSASSGFVDRAVKVWDRETQQIAHTIDNIPSPLRAAAASRDGQWIAAGSKDGTVRVLNWRSEGPPIVLEGHHGQTSAVAVSGDGRWIVTGSDRIGEFGDHLVKVWDREAGQLAHVLEGHTNGVTAVSTTADGTWVVSGSMDQTVKAWNRSDESQQAIGNHSSVVTTVAISDDGRWIVSASLDKTVKVWDRTNQQPPITLMGHTEPVEAVAVSSDGRWIISGGQDHTIRLWQRDTGQLLDTFTADADVTSCALTPDASLCVAGDAAGGIHEFRLLHLSSANTVGEE